MNNATFYAVMALVAALLSPIGSFASESRLSERLADSIDDRLFLTANLRSRWELWNFFKPDNGSADDTYDFLGIRARFGAGWSEEAFELFLEGQATGLIDLPFNATGTPGGPLGLGAVYRAHNRRASDGSVFVKQGYVLFKRLGIEGLRLKGGRMEFSEGNEVLTGDPTLDWLKNFRISQRLIGPFGWSQVGRSFDGGLASLTRGPYNVTASYFVPTQGGFDLAGNKWIDEIDLAYVAFNLTRPEFAKNTDARAFYIYYGDGRGLVPTDNRPQAVRSAGIKTISLSTFGGHWLHTRDTAAGRVDLLAWGVLQEGRWAGLDHSAWAWAAEVGLQPDQLPWKPWFRLGANRGSGDSDPSDDDHKTFFQILPTARLYSLSTFYNLMNSEDYFAQLILKPIKGLLWRTDLHYIRLTESHDLWYFGAGATLANRQVGFGYGGRPASDKRNLMTVLETQLNYQWNRYVSTSVYYGHEFGNSVVRRLFAEDNADFGYIELTLAL